jgi:hypothetical protein
VFVPALDWPKSADIFLAMWMALKRLGYNTYHFKEIGNQQNIKERHMFCWREALIAKLYNSGKPYGKEEFHKLPGRYNVRTYYFLINNESNQF